MTTPSSAREPVRYGEPAPPEPKPGEVIDRLARGKLVQAAYEKSLSEHRDDGHQYSWLSYMPDAQDAWCDAADALVSCVDAELTRLQARVVELQARVTELEKLLDTARSSYLPPT